MRARRSCTVALATVGLLLPVGAAGPVATSAPRPQSATPSDCWPTDNGDPDLISLSFTPDILDVSRQRQVIHFTAMVTDTPGPGPSTGVKSVNVGYGRSTKYVLRTVDLIRGSGDIWAGSLPFERGGARPGERYVNRVSVTDWAGNERTTTTSIWSLWASRSRSPSVPRRWMRNGRR